MPLGFVIAGPLTPSAAWPGPLPRFAQTFFFAHMTIDMYLVAVAWRGVAFPADKASL